MKRALLWFRESPINWMTLRFNRNENLNKKFVEFIRHVSIERAKIYVCFHAVMLLFIVAVLYRNNRMTFYYALTQELATIVPILIFLFGARFRLGFIEAIMPVNAICRGVSEFLFFRNFVLNSTDCMPRSMFKVANIAPFALPVADAFLFRSHYIVFYVALAAMFAIIAYEKKTDFIHKNGICSSNPGQRVLDMLVSIPFFLPVFLSVLLLRYNELRLFYMSETNDRQ